MRLSTLKTLFFSFLVELFFFVLVHLGCERTDMSIQFFWCHFLWGSIGWWGRGRCSWFLLIFFMLRCPAFPQPKHSPFFIISIRLSVLSASTSIVSGSFFWKPHLLRDSSFSFVVFHPKIPCNLRKLLSSLEAHSYHSFKSFGGVGNFRRSRCRG